LRNRTFAPILSTAIMPREFFSLAIVSSLGCRRRL
jgi:hypothetical protein